MKLRKLIAAVVVIAAVVYGVTGEAIGCSTAPVAVIKPKLEYREGGGGMYHTMVGAKVAFDLRDSFDPDPYDYIVKYKLEFWIEGVTKENEYTQCLEDCPGGKRDHKFDGIVTRVFNGSCSYFMKLTVTDNHGASSDNCCWLLVHMSVAKEPPRSFGTITAALDGWLYDSENWASSEVWVAPERYEENVVFDVGHDGLTLRSSDPNDPEVVAKTAIAAETFNSEVVVFGSGITEATKLAGFTVDGPKHTSPLSPGKGIYCNGGSPVIENCIIRGNFTGIYNVNSAHPVISNCVVFGNGTAAGLVNVGASVVNEPVKLRNCVIAGNKNEDLAYGVRDQYYGGGIHNADSRLKIWNCTIFGNHAYFSGGIDNYGTATVIMQNCIVWENTALYDYDENANFGYYEIGNWEGTGAVTAEYSDIRDRLNVDSVYGMNPGDFVECIGEDVVLHDPAFVNAANPASPDKVFGTLDDGLRLKPGSSGSPCIDKGDDSEAPTTDMIGKDRVDVSYIVNGNGGYSDMGAYEAPTVWFVDAAKGGDGKSWGGAFDDLQDALDASGSGDEVWVVAGTYKPGSNRTDSFVLKDGVGLYGGFAGTEASRAARDWKLNSTVLSGDIVVGNEDSYHVVKGVDGGAIDGFVISGGRADGSGVDNRGGGMYNEGCEPVVSNCKFSENYASVGGGMANYSGSKPVLEGCVFEDNIAALGGGMYNDSSAPVVTRCVFSENQGQGAGMCNWGVGANPLVTNCVFSGNWGGYGPGVYNYGGGEDFNNVAVLTNCTFSNNHAGVYEAALYNLFAAPTVTNCILWGDEDEGGGLTEGPAVVNYIKADASFRCCDIEESGGSGDWNGDMGRDGGGNKDESPVFVDAANPAGTFDGKWGTGDDGLRLQDSSPCIDKADGDAAPEKDIRGVGRYDEPGVGGGVGQPDYVEIGAYEYHPVEVHFCGITICDEYKPTIPWQWSKAFVDDTWSDIKVGLGAYANTETAIPDAKFPHTLDSIAIRDGVKLTIWSGENFNGLILLEQRGPAIIQNVYWMGYTYTVDAMTRDFIEPLQCEFPQEVRKYSETDMYDSDGVLPLDYWWEKGSFKIE